MAARYTRGRGASMVESAVILPVFMALLLMFWDSMARVLTKQRIISAEIQQAVNLQPKPLRVTVENDTNEDGPVVVARIKPLNSTDANIYLSDLAADLRNFIRNSGSFSNITVDMIFRLIYLNIDANTGKISWTMEEMPISGMPGRSGTPPTQLSVIGQKAYFFEAGDHYFRYPQNPEGCINSSNRAAVKKNLDDFVSSKLAILNPDIYTKPAGVKIYDVTQISTDIKRYVAFKPLIFGIVCAKYSIFSWKEPLFETILFFPNKDAGI